MAHETDHFLQLLEVQWHMSNDDFHFDIDRVRSPFSKAQLIASLKKYAQLHSVDTFGMREYDVWDGKAAHSETIRVRFGTWGKALQAAGCRAERGGKLDSKTMVKAFRDCWREQKSVPTLRQLEEFLDNHKYPFRTKTYAKVFGGLGRLAKRIVQVQQGELQEAGLYRPRKIEPRRNRTVSQKFRMAVLKRDGYRCTKCGTSPAEDKSVRLEVNHIIPVARDGCSTMENLQALCWLCNQGKKDNDN